MDFGGFLTSMHFHQFCSCQVVFSARHDPITQLLISFTQSFIPIPSPFERRWRLRRVEGHLKPVFRQQLNSKQCHFFEFSSWIKVFPISQGHCHGKKPKELFKKPSLGNTSLSSTIAISLWGEVARSHSLSHTRRSLVTK